MTNFARFDERLHRSPRLFDRHAAINAMLVVEINDVNAESRERRVTSFNDVRRLAVDADERAVLTPLITEFCGEHDLVTTIPDRRSDEAFISKRPVHVGGV